MQDNVNIYLSSPPLPGITRPTHLFSSGHNPLKRRQPWADESADSRVVPESDVSSSSTEGDSGAGGGGIDAGGDSAVAIPRRPRTPHGSARRLPLKKPGTWPCTNFALSSSLLEVYELMSSFL